MLDRTTWLACFMCAFVQPVLSQSTTYQLDPITVIATPDRPGAVLERTAETGSRLGISVQETPAAIDIIDRARMDERGDRSAAEAAQGAVGLTYGNPPGDPSIFSFRGFTTNQITQLYDGIRIGPASMTSRPFDSFNLERVEVLKGPASTLFGEGSVGGAINYVTKRPQRGPFTADGLLSYGSFDNLRLGAGLGGPIGERLHYRVDVSQQTSDTFIDRTDFKYFNFTNGLAWDVTDRLNLELNVDASHDKISPYWGTPFVTSALPGAQPINGILRYADGRFIDERLREKNYNVADNDM
ncbi:MAG: TonB-dependent receptor plug domain-containing protein [Burkholderiales bacterium]